MDLELKGKIAVVTGASKGIGLAITKTLVAEGAHVVAGARSTQSLQGLPGVTAVALDLSAPDGPAQLVERAVVEHGRVDVLVNNVGAVRLRLEGFLGTSDAEFEWAMRTDQDDLRLAAVSALEFSTGVAASPECFGYSTRALRH